MSELINFIPLLSIAISIAFAIYEGQKVGKEDVLPLSTKVVVVVTCIFAPIVAGAIYYYSLKRKFPTKAHWANQASLLIFALEIFIGFAFLFVIYSPDNTANTSYIQTQEKEIAKFLSS